MDITIDTTHPLNDRDRAILQTLLDSAPRQGTPAPHGTPAPRPNSAAAVGAAIAQAPGRAPTAGASARLPVATQPGVSFTESTREDDGASS